MYKFLISYVAFVEKNNVGNYFFHKYCTSDEPTLSEKDISEFICSLSFSGPTVERVTILNIIPVRIEKC